MTQSAVNNHRKYTRKPLPSLYDQEVYEQWINQPFTTSIQWFHQVLVSEALKIHQLSPEVLTTLLNRYYAITDIQSTDSQHVDPLQRSQIPCFASQATKMSADDYHHQIYTHQTIHLKPNSNHDLLNAFMWLSLPLTRTINFKQMIQARESRSKIEPNKRSFLEDRITLFDESGIAIFSDQEDLLALIEQRDWTNLFWNRRESVLKHLEIWIVGHGLYEQLLRPFVGLVGYGRLYKLESFEMKLQGEDKQRLIDRIIAEDIFTLTQEGSFPLSAIPILGFPRWYQANNDRVFYNDSKYFRGPYPNRPVK